MTRRRRPVLECLEARLCLTTPPYYPGTPFQLPQGGNYFQTPFVASPIFADLDGDGKDELITSAAGGQLLAFKAGAGGAPQLFQVYPTGSAADIQSTPIVLNLPNGRKGVFVALGNDESHPGATEDGRIFGFDALTGQVLPGWPVDSGGSFQSLGPNGQQIKGVKGPLASGDLLGDGSTEIVAAAHNGYVTAYRLDGSILWRYQNDDSILSGAVVGDIDRDGRDEVVVGGDTSNSIFFTRGGWINVLDGPTGTARFRIHLDDVVWSAPVLADLQNNGYLDIVVGDGFNFGTPVGNPGNPDPQARAAGNRVYAFDFKGNALPGWPYHTTSDDSQAREVYSSPAVGDLLGTGQLDVVAVDYGGYVHAIGPDGQPLPGWAGGIQIIPPGAPPQFPDLTSPIIADVNGDGSPDIIVSHGAFLSAFDVHGNRLFSNIASNGVLSEGPANAVAVGQFDGQGGLEMVEASGAATAPGKPSLVSIYELPPSPVAPPWPMLRRSASGQAVARSLIGSAVFIDQEAQALEQRAPNQTDKVFFALGLMNNQFTPAQLATAIANSDEAHARIVATEYPLLMGENPNALGLLYFANQLGTIRIQDLDLILATSPQFLARGGANGAGVPGVVTLLYQTLLGRNPSPAELQGNLGSLYSGQVSYPQLVQLLLGNSDAILRHFRPIYAALGQPTIPSDSAAAIVFDIHHGARETDVAAKVVASGGNYAATNAFADWTRTAYRDLLGRQASPDEVAAILGGFDAGSFSPAMVAQFLLNSPEARTNYVQSQFLKYLGHGADPGTLAAFAGYARREDVVVGLITSDEYYQKNGASAAGFVSAVYRDVAEITPLPATVLNMWVQQINAGTLTRQSFASQVVNGQLYYTKLAPNLIFQYLPDESQGVLASGNLPYDAPGQPVNPNPAMVGAFVAALQGGARDEDLITLLVTSPDYFRRAAYDKGFFRSRGVRY